MVILSNNDAFSVRLATLVANYDYETLSNLYQPLIGYSALSLYFTLLGEASLQKVTSISRHESLLAKMQISVGDFLKAKKALEAVGLVRTYLEDNNGAKIYHYDLYAPKTPNEFFNDTLLYGLLIAYVGEIDAKKLNSFYSVGKIPEGNEVSASFKEVFHPDFESNAFLKALQSDPSIGRNRAQMKLEFTYERFFTALKEVSQISEKAFSKSELKEIERLASLYGVDESYAAKVVANNYDPTQEKGKRLNLVKITNAFMEETSMIGQSSFNNSREFSNNYQSGLVSSDSALANKINMMESVSPKDFLRYLQNGTEPATPDLKLINELSKKFKLNNAVINVVVEYCLIKNKNILSKAYCEKISACLARSNITTAIDAMNYLKSTNSKSRKKASYELEEYSSSTPSKENKKEVVNKEEDDEDWDQLLAELNDGSEDKSDGKA